MATKNNDGWWRIKDEEIAGSLRVRYGHIVFASLPFQHLEGNKLDWLRKHYHMEKIKDENGTDNNRGPHFGRLHD